MSGTKRNSESSKLSSAKKRKSTPTENGASSSYSSSVVTRNYEEILNRPAILDVPVSLYVSSHVFLINYYHNSIIIGNMLALE